MSLKIFRRKKGGNWIIRGTVSGCKVYESTGTNNRSLADAKKARLELRLTEEAILGKAATITFAEAVTHYLDAGGEARFLRPVLEYAGSTTLLKDINNQWVRDCAEAVYPGRAASTIARQVVTPISAVVNLAAEDDLCEPKRFRKRGGDNTRYDWITPEQAEDVVNAIMRHQPHLKRPFALMLGGGLRSSEALRVRADNFRLETGEVWIEDTKNGDPRMVRLPRRAAEMLAPGDLPEDGPLCRTPKGKPYILRQNGGGQMAEGFRDAVARANLDPKRITPHVFRHTWATWFAAQTGDFGRLMDFGGWKSPAVANKYRKAAPEDIGGRLLDLGWDFNREDYTRARVVQFRRS